ncbi:MAG: lytic transglycosylase domain-containing protein [Actinobacteria bacterium]|nr:lytic transglycosylase domain-containing protein [Actinomycetota bacterium]
MLSLYRQAAATCPGLPWPVLAAVGRVETNHGRLVAVSSAGAEGPMQFLPGTWARWGVDADGDGTADVWDPTDAVFSAARYLCASGAHDPSGIRRALFAYNPADWYVDLVLEHAGTYAQLVPIAASAPADAAALLANPRVSMTATARGDLASGTIDPRLVALLNLLAADHDLGIIVFRTGHSRYVTGTNTVSLHHCGQAVDVFSVDGEAVSRSSLVARDLVVWLRDGAGALKPDEVGHPFPDLAGTSGDGFFTDASHQHHLHIGYGPRCLDLPPAAGHLG